MHVLTVVQHQVQVDVPTAHLYVSTTTSSLIVTIQSIESYPYSDYSASAYMFAFTIRLNAHDIHAGTHPDSNIHHKKISTTLLQLGHANIVLTC